MVASTYLKNAMGLCVAAFREGDIETAFSVFTDAVNLHSNDTDDNLAAALASVFATVPFGSVENLEEEDFDFEYASNDFDGDPLVAVAELKDVTHVIDDLDGDSDEEGVNEVEISTTEPPSAIAEVPVTPEALAAEAASAARANFAKLFSKAA
jgi:hypothetical protein